MTPETRLLRIERSLSARHQQQQHMGMGTRDPLVFACQQLGFVPDAWQAEVLQWTGTRLLLLCCRQSGKSTVSAILALYQALTVPRSLILLVSPSQRQSSELFKKVQDFLLVVPAQPPLEEDNRLSLQLANGSRIVSLPDREEKIRGFSGVSLLIEDEASRVSDDLYLAMRPMLAVSQGQHILMSTPWGKRGHFYEAWENGSESWDRVKITARACPRITPDFLAEEHAIMPAPWFASEYLCEFVDTVDQIFSHEHVMGALSEDIAPLFGDTPVRAHGALDRRIAPLGDIR